MFVCEEGYIMIAENDIVVAAYMGVVVSHMSLACVREYIRLLAIVVGNIRYDVSEAVHIRLDESDVVHIHSDVIAAGHIRSDAIAAGRILCSAEEAD